MLVKELLKQKDNQTIFSVTPETSVFEAVTEMVDKNVGAMLVIRDGTLVGIITETDFVRAAYTLLGGRVPVDQLELEEKEAEQV